MEIRHRSYFDTTTSARNHQVNTPSHWFSKVTTPGFSNTPITHLQQYDGVHNNKTSPLHHERNQPAAINWKQSLERILHHDNRGAISMKCQQYDQLCSSISNKELVETFPYLLNDIFGFNQSSGWGLNRLEPRMYPTDYRTALHFLSPQGTLFKLINRLLSNQDATFQYPLAELPAGVLELIEKGNIPMFYANKIVNTMGGNNVAHFNSFEYYFVLFAYYVTQQGTSMQVNNWSSAEDVLYIQLLEEYLRYFFPLDLSSSLDKQNFGETNQTYKYSKPMSKFSLWKSPEMMSPSNMWGSPTQNSVVNLNDTGKGEIFLQILCDFWLCINKQDMSYNQVHKLPTIDHARVVRVLVKYFHKFSNMLQETNIQTFTHQTTYQTHEVKRYTVPGLFYNKLYSYLVDCFKHWSLDSSFRMVLETWLSFIQPWRYQQNNMSMNESVDTDVIEWGDFIADNIMFYTTLFMMFIRRALRMETKSTQSMYLIYRVAKVYCQSNLLEVLREALRTTPKNRQSPSSIINETHVHTPYRNKWESPNNHVTIFDNDTTILVQTLCENLSKACIDTRSEMLKSASNKKSGKSKSFMTKVREFFMLDEDYEQNYLNQEEKLIEYLEQACFMFTNMYELPPYQTQPKLHETLEESGSVLGSLPKPELRKHDPNDDGITPDFIMTEDGIRLTELGREQILRRQRHFEFCYNGDPELQPIRSFESNFMVHRLLRLACSLNEKYGEQLYTLYNRNDFISKCLRKISKDVENTRFLNCPIKIPRYRVDVSEVHPRISLRFCGSYYFMGYIFWLMVLARIFGFSWFGILFFIFIALVVSIVYHIDSPPRVMQNEIR